MVAAVFGLLQLVQAVVLLDHLNLNHEKGRHDLVRAFYFDLLRCVPDPRKSDNLEARKGSLWANAGIHQFHLGEGDKAQVFQGVVSLAYASLGQVEQRLMHPSPALRGTAFAWHKMQDSGDLLVTDPWGTRFRLHIGDADERGVQPGDISEPLAMTDLLVYISNDANLAGLARFYRSVLGCTISEMSATRVVVSTGAAQTLTFECSPEGAEIAHDEERIDEEGRSSNDGVHVSMYITDLPSAFAAAEELGCVYVNHRFNRRAYDIDEAREQCMFRILNVVDPEHPEQSPILRLEHEVRSCIRPVGSKYKSCPLREVPGNSGWTKCS